MNEKHDARIEQMQQQHVAHLESAQKLYQDQISALQGTVHADTTAMVTSLGKLAESVGVLQVGILQDRQHGTTA